MSYYRFRRQFLCVDELDTGAGELADLIVDTGSSIIEIEIKVSKSDLWNGEAKKKKHKFVDGKRSINQYYICVPTELIDEAIKWVEETNPKYGIIEFNSAQFNKYGYLKWMDYHKFIKKPKCLNNEYNTNLKERLWYRLNSALVSCYQNLIIKDKE
jgi:hypothetical protein